MGNISSQLEWIQVTIKGNTFKSLNFLKNPWIDQDVDRTLGYQGMAYSVLQRDIGLVADFSNWTIPGIIIIKENKFTDTQQFYQNKNLSSFCYNMDQVTPRIQHVVMQASASNYFQYRHLLSLQFVNNASVLIGSNTFQNISLAGSLIYFEESVDQYHTAIAIYNNSFNLIHGYSGTTVMHFKRQYMNLLRLESN